MNLLTSLADSRDTRTDTQSGAIFSPAPGIVASAHDHGMVILDTARGRLYELCVIGCEIWLSLTGGVKMDTIALEIADRWDAPADRVARDLATYVDDLRRSNLLAKVSR